MSSKKQYYGLDEIGFVGAQPKGRKAAQVQKDIAETVQYLKDKKKGKPASGGKKNRSVSKVK